MILKEAMLVFGEMYFSDLEEKSHLIDVNEDEYTEIWEDLEESFYKYYSNICN